MKSVDLSGTITKEDVAKIFDVSEMTIWRWRKNSGLDSCEIRLQANERYFVRFNLESIIEWGNEHNKAMPGLTKFKSAIKDKKRVRLAS